MNFDIPLQILLKCECTHILKMQTPKLLQAFKYSLEIKTICSTKICRFWCIWYTFFWKFNPHSLTSDIWRNILLVFSRQDCVAVQQLCKAVIKRAGKLAAVGLAAIIKRIGKEKLTIICDGSLYTNFPKFRDYITVSLMLI